MSNSLQDLLKQLEAVTIRLENLAASSNSVNTILKDTFSTPVDPVKVPTAVEKHDIAVNTIFEKYFDLSQSLGGLIAEQAQFVKQIMNIGRDIIYISTLSQKPDMTSSAFKKLIEPMKTAIESIMKTRDANRSDPLFNNLSTVAEGVSAFGWFTCEPTPVPFIREMKEAAQFYSNRVVKEWKEKDPKHVEWARSFLGTLESLSVYVKENFVTGLIWNAKGDTIDAFVGKTFSIEDIAENNNKPSDATKLPKTALESTKWVVEHHENNHEILINDTAINQAVHIYDCKNSTVQIKGKVNAVTVDSCVKCGVAVDSTIATVDVINSKSFALQVFETVPTIAVDQCDGGEIYLSKECLDVEILSAKSTSLNVLLPKDGEFRETPVPEQLKTTIEEGKLVSATVEHAGQD